VKGEPDELQTLAVDKMPIEKSGFLYVYTSNETQQDVLFDNVTVAAVSGPLLEETHYYPFGLTMAGISSNALKGVNYPENRKKYNGIEFTKDLDLNIYDAQLRNLDPQIGRWNQVDPKTEKMEMWSPYVSNYDNPIRFNDFLGDEPDGGPGDPSYYARADNKGAIISANQQEYDQNPVGAFLKDAFHLAAEVTGVNSLDDYIHNRVVGENSPGQVAIETAQLGISLSRGKGGKPGEVGEIGKGGTVKTPLELRIERLNKQDRSGKDFTQAGKEVVKDANKVKNDGKMKCEGCGVEVQPAKKHETGKTPPANEAHVDHIIRKREGGRGNPDNGQVLCRQCNVVEKH
jgi:RHS repeat-associated protein